MMINCPAMPVTVKVQLVRHSTVSQKCDRYGLEVLQMTASSNILWKCQVYVMHLIVLYMTQSLQQNEYTWHCHLLRLAPNNVYIRLKTAV